MSRTKTLVYVLAHVVVLMLLLTFVFIAAPTTDDYAFAIAARKNTLWGAMVEMFNGWGGRYVQALVASVWYKGVDRFGFSYSTGLLLFIVILYSGIYVFIRQVFAGVLTRCKVLVVSVVLLAGLVRSFSTLDESIYWNIGGITYLLPAALFLWFLGALLYSYRSKRALIFQPVLCLLILFIDGINEAFVIMNVLVLCGFILYMLLEKSFRVSYLIALIAALLGVGLIVISKGNTARMGYYPQAGQFLYSLFWGSLSGTQSILQGLVDPYVWGSLLLFIPLFMKVRKRIPTGISVGKITAIYIITILLMLYGTVAIHYYATGNRPVQRLMVVWYIVFYIGLVPLACLLAPTLKRFYDFALGVVMKVFRSERLVRSILFVVVIISFLLINNPPKAVYDLVYNVPGFMKEMDDFNKAVRELQASEVRPKELVIEKFEYRPVLLKTPTDVDYGIGPYYGFDSVKIVPRKSE